MAQGFTLTPWTLWMPKREYSSIEQRLHHEIEAFVRWSSESPEEKEVRSHVIAQITKILHERYPRCLVQVFGSSCTGLGVPVADIDMVISNLPAESKQAKAKILYQLSPIFLRRFVTNEAQILKWAKVPLITFTTTHMLGAFNVDIGINHIDGVSGVELIKQFVDEMPALRPLVMVLKSFLKPRGIGSAATGGLGSYGLTCMAISFLQLNPAKLETRFLQNPFEAESLGILLKEFFKYYSRDFPYTTSYISITEATLKPKGQAPWIQQNLPDRFVIECPVTCKHDVTKPLTRTNEVRMAFAEALSFIESKASLDRPQTLGPEIIAVDKTVSLRPCFFAN
ncbi:Nucleotidyltransferase [Mycena floridula]|nr:Nucleotidyltransferase [Mycena floridula]